MTEELLRQQFMKIISTSLLIHMKLMKIISTDTDEIIKKTEKGKQDWDWMAHKALICHRI